MSVCDVTVPSHAVYEKTIVVNKGGWLRLIVLYCVQLRPAIAAEPLKTDPGTNPNGPLPNVVSTFSVPCEK